MKDSDRMKEVVAVSTEVAVRIFDTCKKSKAEKCPKNAEEITVVANGFGTQVAAEFCRKLSVGGHSTCGFIVGKI